MTECIHTCESWNAVGQCSSWKSKMLVYYLFIYLFIFFFFWESFNLWSPLSMIALYHQVKTPISFWCRRRLNPRSLIQPSETLPVELTGTHKMLVYFCFTLDWESPYLQNFDPCLYNRLLAENEKNKISNRTKWETVEFVNSCKKIKKFILFYFIFCTYSITLTKH